MSEVGDLGVSIVCSSCRGEIRLGDKSCPSCRRQITKDEARALRARWEASDPEAARQSDWIVYGRYTLVVVALLSAVEGIIYGMFWESPSPAISSGVVIAVMLGLFFWSEGRELAAMLLGLSIYVSLQVLGTAISDLHLAQGTRTQVFVIVTLSSGIAAELALRRRVGNRG